MRLYDDLISDPYTYPLCGDTPIDVLYDTGPSRAGDGLVDYMLATLIDPEGEDVELYAEAPIDESDEYDDFITYPHLQREILAQAEAAGVDAARLKWWLVDTIAPAGSI